ncbi:MAG TPA: hypothetical protein VGM90_24525 [Kofleriaceae bacterium]
MSRFSVALVVLVACHPPQVTAPPPTPENVSHYKLSVVALPGASPEGIFLDYLGFDPTTGFVWVPAGPTGSVDVVDTATGTLTRIEGFATKEIEREGKKRTVGPSSVTFGRGLAFVGNRGDSTICAVDAKTLVRGMCGSPLDAMPDGIAYVAETDELWVTTPHDKSLRILDAQTLAQKERLPFDGEPEGFAVDAEHHRFYTNLEDKDLTLAIDVASHKTVATWKPMCGDGGPHGLRLAEHEGFLFVACSSKVQALDISHDGNIAGTLPTGAGVDDLDYVPGTHRLYVPAASDGTLSVIEVGAGGALTLVDTVPTKKGARNGVVDTKGAIYIGDGHSSALLVVAP